MKPGTDGGMIFEGAEVPVLMFAVSEYAAHHYEVLLAKQCKRRGGRYEPLEVLELPLNPREADIVLTALHNAVGADIVPRIELRLARDILIGTGRLKPTARDRARRFGAWVGRVIEEADDAY
jgi:hypothetical protein